MTKIKVLSLFMSGFFHVGKGFMTALKYKKLRFLCWSPFLLYAVLVFVFLYTGWSYLAIFLLTMGKSLVQPLLNFLSIEEFLSFLSWPLTVLFYILSFSIFIYFLYLMATVIASPIYGFLAERTLILKQVPLPQDRNLLSTFKRSLKIIIISLVRSFLFFTLFGVLFFLSLVLPLLTPALFVLPFFLISMDCLDYGLEVMGVGLRGRFLILKTHFWQILGMSFFWICIFWIPVIIIFLLPFAVIGGALLLAENSPQY